MGLAVHLCDLDSQHGFGLWCPFLKPATKRVPSKKETVASFGHLLHQHMQALLGLIAA